MSKKHDENKDLRLVSRIAKIDYINRTIQSPRSAIIGNKTWGRIDFLTHYCGWTFIWNNDVYISKHNISLDDETTSNNLTNKKRRKS